MSPIEALRMRLQLIETQVALLQYQHKEAKEQLMALLAAQEEAAAAAEASQAAEAQS